MQFLQHAVFDHRDPGLARGHIDQDFLRHRQPPWRHRQWGWHATTRQQTIGVQQRQPHHAGVAAGKMFDPALGPTLDGVGAGLVQWLAAGDIGGNAGGVDRGEGHLGNDQLTVQAARADHHHRGHHLVGAPGQSRQHRPRVGGIDRLAEDLAVQHDLGIRTEHPRLRVIGQHLGQPGARLVGGNPAHILFGAFSGRALLDDLQVKGLEGASESGQQLVASGSGKQDRASAQHNLRPPPESSATRYGTAATPIRLTARSSLRHHPHRHNKEIPCA